jgi:hypothetical protein
LAHHNHRAYLARNFRSVAQSGAMSLMDGQVPVLKYPVILTEGKNDGEMGIDA